MAFILCGTLKEYSINWRSPNVASPSNTNFELRFSKTPSKRVAEGRSRLLPMVSIHLDRVPQIYWLPPTNNLHAVRQRSIEPQLVGGVQPQLRREIRLLSPGH
jgi:hypothetical protein